MVEQLKREEIIYFCAGNALNKILKTLNKLKTFSSRCEFRPKEGSWQIYARYRSAVKDT
jgi:hypothetical protein